VNRRLWCILTIAIAACSTTAAAREHHNRDSDFARGALQRGEVLPVERVLALAHQQLPGDVVEVRLEPHRGGHLTYEIRVLTPSGQIRDLVLDARTGAFVKIEE
jgi:uncharacterized membrane protein YkoI